MRQPLPQSRLQDATSQACTYQSSDISAKVQASAGDGHLWLFNTGCKTDKGGREHNACPKAAWSDQ